ncbi:tetratricopeptide repeat protein [Glutamicibacter sp. JL.03c]|uniref:tetratricopeptide repeat protein n=1 Tax=Glutamicibacter sp. JL.03c TaxID=2984842 RepID=UPI0021F703CE|nr:tetratricopeptide repeat protein [Glutamicibacter sp. JL.03c]UYQ78878.1 tetratricopeptide repeat protein [Glutamicibacter sp. JL.03c]
MAGELLDAEKSVAKAIEMAPGNSHYLVRLSYVFAAGKDYARSASAMQKAIAISPVRSAYHLRHGECLIKSGELEAAEKSMQEAVRLAPDGQRAKDRLRAVEAAVGRQRSKASA